jgi:hypothetical protein
MSEEESNQEVSNDDPKNQSPPNPTVIIIFFGMVVLFLLGLAYLFWPKDEETPSTDVATAEIYQKEGAPTYEIAILTKLTTNSST